MGQAAGRGLCCSDRPWAPTAVAPGLLTCSQTPAITDGQGAPPLPPTQASLLSFTSQLWLLLTFCVTNELPCSLWLGSWKNGPGTGDRRTVAPREAVRQTPGFLSTSQRQFENGGERLPQSGAQRQKLQRVPDRGEDRHCLSFGERRDEDRTASTHGASD